ncbi:MAG: DNA-damage-inducible protein D [Candidatus Peribacteria bacterium]|jgi:DNA-damage-inducible protein D|nr:DNA-damage-inducible protein D [Candidatus Peribacteria bacterium]
MRNKNILKKKKLKPKDSLMDNVGSEELAANLFRATQAEAKIKRENIIGQDKASKAHYEVGKDTRGLIQKMGGTMPENLPPTEHIKETKKRIKQQEKLDKKN